jgi:peptidoglycan/LPS O-acetylase OafA/YrhL
MDFPSFCISRTSKLDNTLYIGKTGYLPEIDGLRGLAVLLVVIYHAGIFFSGGFVGVDVFFVISGYLITSILLREILDSRFSIIAFWERRLRRILPAAGTMVLAAVATGALCLLKTDYEMLGKSVFAHCFLWSNVFFKNVAGDYFSASPSHALLHTWSLSVEEQFYLLFPLFLALLLIPKAERHSILKWLFVAFIFINLLACMLALQNPKHQRAVFYFTQSRIWEFLCGSLIAVLPRNWCLRSALAREAAAFVGIACILLPALFYSKSTTFPGLAAVPPCLGAAAIIWSNLRDPSAWQPEPPTKVGQILVQRPLLATGLISYSLYLWHWPVLVFFHYGWNDFNSIDWPARLAPLLIAFALGALSWRYIEKPFRERQLAVTRRAMFIWAGTGTILLCALGGLANTTSQPPFARDRLVTLNSEAAKDWPDRHYVSIKDIESGRIPKLGIHSSGTNVRLLLWGDSHSWCAASALDDWCKARGVAGEIIAYGGTPPVMDAVFRSDGLREKTPPWAEAVFRHIQTSRVTDVCLSGFWSLYEEFDAVLLENALRVTIKRLTEVGCRVWVLMDQPCLEVSVPRLLTRNHWIISGALHGQWRQTSEMHHRKNSVMYRLSQEDLGATFLDPSGSLLDLETGLYRVEEDGVSLYIDPNHLTKRASKLLLAPLFDEKLIIPINQ